MRDPILGIHHVTAICGDPQPIVDFYADLLGLRLVKTTINYDDPGTYHLYFGDDVGRPGTLITFFPWPGAPRGRHGTGQVATTSFTVPEGALGWWSDRLAAHAVDFEGPFTRLEEEVLALGDPDGLRLELVADPAAAARPAWEAGPVPEAHAIRGFHAVALAEEGYERTARLLTDTLGFRLVRDDASRSRYEMGEGGPGARVDVLCLPDAPRGRVAVGTVHHVAWRVADDLAQEAYRDEVARAGLNVTPVIDRTYFHSIYFREPSGVLFEIATDPPGMTVDEPAERLGSELVLPRWLEASRERIEAGLPRLRRPVTA